MAYALQPLIQILEQQANLVVNIKPQIEPLLEKAKFLECIENTSLYKSSENKELESRIRDVAYEAEDVIESYILDSDSHLDLTEVMEIFDSIKEELLKIVGEKNIQAAPSYRSLLPQLMYDDVIGIEEQRNHLAEILFQGEEQPSLRIIPIVGIGGIGKTTLAKMIYNDSSISSLFDVQGWTTISQKYNLKMNLINLLCSISKFDDTIRSKSDDELGECVRNSLRCRRYLIVVDDIWDMDAWDKMRSLFPDDENGSRIILTTREPIVADYARLLSEPFSMSLLPLPDSWCLLKQKVFGNESCPPELVETGMRISLYARGLPLALMTMAGHLSTLEKTIKVWEVFEEQHINLVEKIQEVDSNKYKTSETQDDRFMEGMVNLFLKDGHQMIELITRRQQELKIIPIVGMGGSGKTTMARLVYNRSLHAGHFDIHAWFTSSGHNKTKDALREILHSLREGMGTEEMPLVSDDEVGIHVHKTLYQRRYLVVLDNIKDVNNWEMLKGFFPDNNNGSRIILTAMEWNAADYDRITPFRMNSYWEFLLQKAFEQDFISSKIEDKIRTFWKIFETNQRSRDIKRESQFDLISMSYDNLPCHLKPCFLYMGAFPEDYEIKASKIINLWIAEGFVKPMHTESLEGAGEIYLKALLDRNLLFATQRNHSGKVEAIGIHDEFWKFCCKKAYEENFMWCKDLEVQDTPQDEEKIRRVSVHSLYQDSDWMELYWARSLLCVGSVSQDLAPIFLRLRLLRVLDILEFVSAEFPEEMLQMFNLRYLALTCHSHIPSSISDFQHLQTLVVPGASSLPSELWEMKQLRHIECKQTRTWSVPEENVGSNVVQENLHTLSNVPFSMMSEVFLRKFPNIRKLQSFCDFEMETWLCLDCLHMLESLKCSSTDGSPATRNFLSYLLFPISLKKLTLRSCEIRSEDIHRIENLPCLEQLKLQKCEFMDEVWESDYWEYSRIRVLHMEDLINLVLWKADDTNFPSLERLIIRGCWSMQEIPLEIGDIDTLRLIAVDDCGPSLAKSALSILEEQLECGNLTIRVSITNTRTA